MGAQGIRTGRRSILADEDGHAADQELSWWMPSFSLALV
jgi:hypothetical protein